METIDIVLVSLIVIVIVILVALVIHLIINWMLDSLIFLTQQLLYYMRTLDRKFTEEENALNNMEANGSSEEFGANLKTDEQNVEPKQFYVDPYSFEEVPYKVKATTGLKNLDLETEFESLRVIEWDGYKEDKTSSIVSWSGSRDIRAPQSPPLNTLKESFGDFTPISFRSTEDNNENKTEKDRLSDSDSERETQRQNEDSDKSVVNTQKRQLEANESDKNEEGNETKPKES